MIFSCYARVNAIIAKRAAERATARAAWQQHQQQKSNGSGALNMRLASSRMLRLASSRIVPSAYARIYFFVLRAHAAGIIWRA